MATTEKKPKGEQKPAGEAAAQPSARERYRSRYSEAHPDLNLDDEEAFYGQANQNLDELENLRESNRLLGETFERVPLLAGLLTAAKEGQNPWAYMVENIGPDMDIRELVKNPDFVKTMGEAVTKFMENQKAAKDKQEEIGKNAVKSLQTLKELQKEMGLSDEACIKMANDFFGEFDENGNPVGKDSFMHNASNGIVTKGMWESLVKGRNYDNDIADATEKARVTALNDKFQNEKKDFKGTGLPQSMPSGGSGREPKPKKNDGSLASFKESLGV